MARIFTAQNCDSRAVVYDVDTKQHLPHVASVDIDSGEVVCYEQPLRVIGDELATWTYRYRAIHPIYGGKLRPQMFHCYA